MVSKIFKTMPALAAGVLLVSFSLCGCGKGSQQPDTQLQAAQQEKSQEMESEKLKNIEARLETLFETLGGPSVKMEESKGKAGGESGQKQQDTQDQGTQQKGTQEQGTQQQGDQEQGTQEQGTREQGTQEQSTQEQGTQQQDGQQKGTQEQGAQKKGGQQKGVQEQGTQQKGGQQQGSKWSEIDMIINNLHYQWNDFMPDIAKKGVDMKLVDNFDNALNQLTTLVAGKDSEKILGAANALYAHIPDLYSLYRTKMSPEAKRMVYYARNIILESARDNWEQVEKDDKAMEKSWALLRNTLEKEQQEIGDKLNFSIYELNKVVLDKNKQLSDIKGRIVLSNIKELQKSFEEKK